MSIASRRDFLVTAGSFALAAAAGAPARAAMGPNDKFDLVIKGGDVLDPSQIAARASATSASASASSRRSRPTSRRRARSACWMPPASW